ncbi:MAG: flagellar hook-associated protein FlgL [Myxococcota bacterium]
MRVTDSMLLRTSLADLNLRREELARVQEQASSGLRINRPSDDPVGVRTATVLRNDVAAAEQMLRNQDRAEVRLGATETALDRALEVVARARELAVAGANGALDAEARLALAAEVAQLHDELVAASNSRSSGGYLFSGFTSDVAPFVPSGPFGSPPAPSVAFAGDASEVMTEVEPGVRLPVGLDGRRVFLGDGDGNGLPDAGREDVFAVLEGLWEDLQANDQAAVAARLDELDRAQLQLSLERTSVGASTSRLEAARAAISDRQLESTEQLSNIEDADTIAVLSELVEQETALQAALQAMSRVLPPSLMDFLA